MKKYLVYLLTVLVALNFAGCVHTAEDDDCALVETPVKSLAVG